MRRERHYGDRVMTCFIDRAANVHALLANAVAARPDHEALICDETRLTYAELNTEVAHLAGGLAARGVSRGDRVALLLGNGIPIVALAYAIARLGAIMVPLNVREKTPGLHYALTDCGAMLVVADATVAPLVPSPDTTPALKHRISVGAADGFIEYETLRSADPINQAAEVAEEDIATILYTSGTTGRPKGATLTGLGLVHSAMSYRNAVQLESDDRNVVVVPMSHVTGLLAGIHTSILAAATIVVARTFDAPGFLELAARERMSFTVLVPAMYNLCLHKTDITTYDLSSWRVGGYGGASMPAPTIARLAEALPQLGLMNCYGATETTSPVTIMPTAETAARRLSVGLPVPGSEILVMDDDGCEVGPDQHGELWHSGPMIVPGYWENPEATAREFVAGFWKSGDIGSKDAEGFIYVHDRKKDMINRGGYKIYTAEVESVLLAVTGVREVAVLAKPCPILGERVHAVVIADDGSVEEASLTAHCATELADYQCPETFTFRADPLPRNANGKVMKRKIREELGFTAAN